MQHIAERDRPQVKARMRRAWRETDHERALEQLTRLADELEHPHPGAAGSLREGMEETLTVLARGRGGRSEQIEEVCSLVALVGVLLPSAVFVARLLEPPDAGIERLDVGVNQSPERR